MKEKITYEGFDGLWNLKQKAEKQDRFERLYTVKVGIIPVTMVGGHTLFDSDIFIFLATIFSTIDFGDE